MSSSLSFEVYTDLPYDSSGAILYELAGLEFADPATTTTYVSSYSNTSSWTASGSAGYQGGQGLNVTAGGQITSSQQTTYTVPPTTILNEANLPSLEPMWQFIPQSGSGNTFQFSPTWTWYVPRDAYPSGGTGSGEFGFLAWSVFVSGGVPKGYAGPTCTVPYPFPAWTVDPPQLSSLEPASTTVDGGQFTITGQNLYPDSVVAVLIGGTAVPLSTNVGLVDDTTLIVVVPGGYGSGTYEVQVNTQFNGENRFSNTLDLSLTD
jgi:hypothetical protein